MQEIFEKLINSRDFSLIGFFYFEMHKNGFTQVELMFQAHRVEWNSKLGY